jgi:hypothetical protein
MFAGPQGAQAAQKKDFLCEQRQFVLHFFDGNSIFDFD